MRTLRLRQPGWISRTGRILTHVTIVNALDPAREISCEALVDTGAWGLMLPRAWKERLGALQVGRTVDMVTADQRVVSGEVCGPARPAPGGQIVATHKPICRQTSGGRPLPPRAPGRSRWRGGPAR